MESTNFFPVDVRLPEEGMQQIMQTYRAHVAREDAKYRHLEAIPTMSTDKVDNDAGFDGVRCPYIMDSLPEGSL